nr:MAG TPA: hypothetical protein [Bacteriophage sp.]
MCTSFFHKFRLKYEIILDFIPPGQEFSILWALSVNDIACYNTVLYKSIDIVLLQHEKIFFCHILCFLKFVPLPGFEPGYTTQGIKATLSSQTVWTMTI